MGRHGRRVSDDGKATALSAQCQRARAQLALWRAHRAAWDGERDDGGLTWSYWRGRKRIGRELRPFAVVQLAPLEAFSTVYSARMAGVVALCLVLRHFQVIAWTYAQWADYLGCCPRTAGTAARELAASGWLEIRAHFAAFDVEGKQRHAQLPSTFAPGYLMRVAFDAWEAQGRRAKERWRVPSRPVGAVVVHSASPKNCQPKRESGSYSSALLPDLSYGSLGCPQLSGQKQNECSGNGDLFAPPASPLITRAMERLALEGGGAVRDWAEIVALTLQGALRQAFPAPVRVGGRPQAGRRYAAGRRPLDINRWRPWIIKRTAWKSRDDRRREVIRDQLRLLRCREWKVDPNGPPPTHLAAGQLAYWYGHGEWCSCAICFAAREEKLGEAGATGRETC